MTEPVEPEEGDAFGAALLAQMQGRGSGVVVERDDGFVDVDRFNYFADVTDDASWPWLRERIGSRVLDIGAGAGRASLYLQSVGVDVTALDVSPGAIEVCRRRGVASTVVGTVASLAATHARFDTFLGLGNNLGLIGSAADAGAFLSALRAMGGRECRLVGTMLDPYQTDNELHLAYHERNRRAGRLGGEVRIRVRYQRLATRWFGLLWANVEELSDVGYAHGWDLVDATDGVVYCAELRAT